MGVEEAEKARAGSKRSKHVKAKLAKRQKERKIEQRVADQFNSNQLYACISSRPVRSSRWLRPRGQRARLLHQEAREKEEVSNSRFPAFVRVELVGSHDCGLAP